VLVTSRKSDDGLLRALRGREGRLRAAGIEAVYGIGDCVGPRLLADCVFDRHQLARAIDTDDPARPPPFVRERRLARLVGEWYERPAPRPRLLTVRTERVRRPRGRR